MKLETFVIVSKAFCAFAGPALLALNTGLSQWSNEVGNPSTIQWVMILSGTFGAGLLGYGSWTSNAFGKFVAGKTGINITNGDTVSLTKQTT